MEIQKTNKYQTVIPKLELDNPFWIMALGQVTRHNRYYWKLSADSVRNEAYEQFFREYAKGKVVCDLGSGTGILLHLAHFHGAKKCIGIDNNLNSIAYLKGLYPSWDLHYNNIFDMQWPEADIYVHSLFSDNIYDNKVKEMFDRAEKLGVKDKVFPNQIDIYEVVGDTIKDTNYNIIGEGMEDFHERHSMAFHELYKTNLQPPINVQTYDIVEGVYSGHIQQGWSLGKLRDAGRNGYLGWTVSFPNSYFSNWELKSSYGVGNNWKW